MNRLFLKERDAFPKSPDEYTQPVERLLRVRRVEMDASWEGLEEGWRETTERMVAAKVRPRTNEANVVRLNVGGSKVNVCWHLLAKTEGFESSVLGALLEGVLGEGRIPRDAEGRTVLDESPACIKHIIHTMLRYSSSSGRSSSAAERVPENVASSAVAVDEIPCFVYTAHAMGLPGYVPAHLKYTSMVGGSTILDSLRNVRFCALIREWTKGSTDEMTLIYRATRDGFSSEAFKARCGEDSPNTVSLIRVSSGQGNGEHSVVGDYAVDPRNSRLAHSLRGMFVFMLKDGSPTRKRVKKPTKYDPTRTYGTFLVPQSDGPYCGTGGLVTIFDDNSGSCTVKTRYDGCFPSSSSTLFLALNGNKVVDIEVYRCSTLYLSTTTTAPTASTTCGEGLDDPAAHDIRLFGETIAGLLMEERVVLDRAVKETNAAGSKLSAAVGALETVYGPSVAAGEQDTVVELNVRGTRMTTLRSTLQACPRSALATMFDEEKWPAIDKDKDEHGRWLVDCSPTCFSKILDVLRMRKRASWSRGAAAGRGAHEESNGILQPGVFIKQADVETFSAAVNMYFPGCGRFIMDLVQP